MDNSSFSRKISAVSGQNIKERDYWLGKLSGELVKTTFPYDYHGNKNRETASLKFTFNPGLSARMIKLSNHSHARLHIILTAGLVLLLEKYNYNSNGDIIVGVPIQKQETEARFLNTALVLRNQLHDGSSFKELILQVRQTILEAIVHVNYSLESLLYQLNLIDRGDDFPLFDVAVLLENIHHHKYISHLHPNMVFSFNHQEGSIEGVVHYNRSFYRETAVEKITKHLSTLFQTALFNLDMRLDQIDILSEEEKQQLLVHWNDTHRDYPPGKTIHGLFREQAEQTPDHTALVNEKERTADARSWNCSTGGCQNENTRGSRLEGNSEEAPFRQNNLYGPIHFSYRELGKNARQLAHYLKARGVTRNSLTAVMTNRGFEMVTGILAVLKAGGAYVPLDPALPGERIKTIIQDAQINIAVSRARYIKLLNRLQWECPSFHTFICLDSWDIVAREEEATGELMDEKLWDYVAETAVDEVSGGGWQSSYTGQFMSKEEMNEYGNNILQKLTPLLHKNMRLLEIGCASGITMYRLAPKVGIYYGTDLSPGMVKMNRERVKKEGHKNILLECLPAHEIDKINEKNFDVIILNSVIQAFPGHNYLRNVIDKAMALLAPQGYLFIGDVMDQDLKQDLIDEMNACKQANKNKNWKTKTDFSTELFISRGFFTDLTLEKSGIREVTFSSKIHTIENELTKFRYDALIHIDKSPAPAESRTLPGSGKLKHQHDLTTLAAYGWEKVMPAATENDLAYVIYTSGTTGRPKGVPIRHGNFINLIYYHGELFGEGIGARISQAAGPGFDAMAFEVWPCLAAGAALVITPGEIRADVVLMKAWLIRQQITISFQSTAMAELLLQQDWCGSGAAMEILRTAGDRLTAYLDPKAVYPFTFYNLYGPTEDTVWTTWAKIGPKEQTRDRGVPAQYPDIGIPIGNHRVYIMDNHLKLLPMGIPGELCIAGSGLARGYLNLPELTAEKFSSHLNNHPSPLYRTGDLARWLPYGAIEFIGRLDLQVKVRGYRIELAEIENQLLKHHDVKKVIVIPRQENSEKYLCAYIIYHNRASADEAARVAEIREYLEQILPDYMVPSFFVSLDKFPLTPNGKIDKRALPAPGIVTGTGYTAPGNQLEKQLVEMWARVLKIDKKNISVTENFFHLGGHSLKATILVSRMHRDLNLKVPLANIFRYPTIRELAQHIDQTARNRFKSIRPYEKKEYYPLSSSQKRLYFLQQLTPQSVVYNVSGMVELEKSLPKEQLSSIFRKLIARHESFRTCFRMVEEEPVQQVHPHLEFEIEYDTEGITRDFIRPFDLLQAPLLRIGLAKRENSHYILLMDMHHIVSDGASIKILREEFQALNSGGELPGLRLQYKDYAGWQSSPDQQDFIKQQESFWLELLSGEIPVLHLPLDFPRPSLQSFAGSAVNFVLDMKETAALKRFSKENDTTLYMTVLALVNVFLSKLSGQEDIIIGTPIAARRHADLEGIVGMFVNTLALRNCPPGQKTFSQFLSEVKEQTLKAFENQEYQFEDLVNRLSIPRDLSRNPVFDITFNLLNQPQYTYSGISPGININEKKRNKPVRGTAKFDLDVLAIDYGEKIYFNFEYCTKLFKQETIERFIRYFKKILTDVLDSGNQKICDIEIIPAHEKRQVLHEFNNTAVSYPQDKLLHELFSEMAAKTPEHTALIGAMYLSYSQLNERADQLACLLVGQGIRPDMPVAVMVGRSIEMVIGILGILKAGGAYLPIDPEYPRDRIDYILKDSGAKVIVTTANLYENRNMEAWESAAGLEIVILDFFSLEISHQPLSPVPAASLAYIIYTSGSTGNPKGVLVEHKSVINILLELDRLYTFQKSDVYLLKTSYTFDVSVTELFGWYLGKGGGKLAILKQGAEKDPEEILNVIAALGITHINFVPSMFAAFISALETRPMDYLSGLKYIFLAGEALPSDVVLRFRELCTSNHPVMENIYGPTEAAIYASKYSLSLWNGEGNIPIGKPMANVKLYVRDNQNHLQPIGIPGELCIGGAGVARGYLNNPALTAEKFVEHMSSRSYRSYIYKTGDLVRWLSDGNIEFLGRMDHQVKIRGFRIELEEIESALMKHPEIKETAAILNAAPAPETGNREQRGNGDQHLCAYYVANHELTVTQLREHLQQWLPDYMIPAYFIPISRVPLTSSGKISIGDLPRVENLRPHLGSTYTAPGTRVESTIARAWQQVLNLEKVGIHDNFFEVGGNSLKIIRLRARLEKLLHRSIAIENMFRYPTIHSFANYIDQPGDDKEIISEVAIDKSINKMERAIGLLRDQRRRQK